MCHDDHTIRKGSLLGTYNKSAFSKPKSKKEINSKEGVNSENHYYLCVGIFELCGATVMGLTKVTLMMTWS